MDGMTLQASLTLDASEWREELEKVSREADSAAKTLTDTVQKAGNSAAAAWNTAASAIERAAAAMERYNAARSAAGTGTDAPADAASKAAQALRTGYGG